jgi:tRNA (guanine37-N1)-methyltransferase
VPEVLVSGDHGKIAEWREEQAKERTEQRRPGFLRQVGPAPKAKKKFRQL